MKKHSNAADCHFLENYVEFLGLFRGTVKRENNRITIESDRTEFSMLFPLKELPANALQNFSGSVVSLPWLKEAEAAIQQSSLSKKNEIVFMSKPLNPYIEEDDRIQVRVAQSVKDIEEFSLAQSQGFLESEADFNDWHPWLKDANLRNQNSKNVKFLIADIGAKPSAVTLLVETKDACGVYAVATPPAQRKKGLSTCLLAAAEQIAKDSGYIDMCLQVTAGAYAEQFYQRLGFKEEYRIGIWKK